MQIQQMKSLNNRENEYEDLVSNTKAIIKHLCEFVRVNFSGEMVSDRTKMSQQAILGDANPNKSANRLANQSPTTSRIDSWKIKLSPTQIATIESITKKAMLQCNYSPLVAN